MIKKAEIKFWQIIKRIDLLWFRSLVCARVGGLVVCGSGFGSSCLWASVHLKHTERRKKPFFPIDTQIHGVVIFGSVSLLYWIRKFGCFPTVQSHVLWCAGVGSIAHCRPNHLLSVLILSNTRTVYGNSRRDSCIADQSCVFLWLCYYYCFHGHWVVCHCGIST